MQTNILWTGREYYSLENCLVDETRMGATITSTIVGSYNGTIYKVAYHLETNARWQTVFFKIDSRHNNIYQSISYTGDGNGNWTKEGVAVPQFKGCIDIDIPLTPFTNTLPIRRLQMQTGASQQIQVIYCDLLEQTIRPVHQQYTCIGATTYHYENIPNDFEADIIVNEAGLVVDYPQLFVQTELIILPFS